MATANWRNWTREDSVQDRAYTEEDVTIFATESDMQDFHKFLVDLEKSCIHLRAGLVKVIPPVGFHQSDGRYADNNLKEIMIDNPKVQHFEKKPRVEAWRINTEPARSMTVSDWKKGALVDVPFKGVKDKPWDYIVDEKDRKRKMYDCIEELYFKSMGDSVLYGSNIKGSLMEGLSW